MVGDCGDEEEALAEVTPGFTTPSIEGGLLDGAEGMGVCLS